MKQYFEQECIIVVGQTGAGKSTWISKFIKFYKRDVICYKHFINLQDKAFDFLTEKKISNLRQGAKPGQIVKCKMGGKNAKDFKEFCKWVITDDGFRNGLIVIDDSIMFERDRPSQEFLDLIVAKRHIACDIIVVYHSLTSIPIEVFDYSNKIILFNTKGNPRYKKDKIANYENLLKGAQIARQNYLNPQKKYLPVIVRL